MSIERLNILMACAFEPANRFKTPTAFKNALSAVKGGQVYPIPESLNVNASAPVQRAPKSEKTNAKPVVKKKAPRTIRYELSEQDRDKLRIKN